MRNTMVTPNLSAVFTALATIANLPGVRDDHAGFCNPFSVVYAYLNAPGHINVRAPSAALSVQHLPHGHPVFMVLQALHHATYGGTHCNTAQLVSTWWESDN